LFCANTTRGAPVSPAKPWKIAADVAVVPVTMSLPLNVPVTTSTVSVANPVAVVATTGYSCEPDNPTVRVWLFRTFTQTLGETVILPVLSVNCAVRACVPSATVPVFHWNV
jgi:hypothetical protein